MYRKLRFLILFACLTLAACAHAIVNLKCPGYPIMLQVEVHNGAVKGKDLDNAIKNNETLWQHIHLVEKLGCKAD